MSKIRRYSNTAEDTTLNGAIVGSSTSLVLNSVNNYPTPPFTIAIDAEIILVEETTGTTFKGLERGFDNTVPSDHANGAAVEHKAIADDFSYRWEDVLTTPTWGDLDDEFDDADLHSDWTEVTPTGTVAWTEARGVLSARFTGQTQNDCVALVRSLGSLTPPVYLYAPVRTFGQITPNISSYLMAGPLFSDGTTTTSNVVWQMPYKSRITNDTNALTATLRAGTFTNISATQASMAVGSNLSGWLHLRLDWVSANSWKAWYSPDGVSWTSLGQGNWSQTMTPTHVGIGVSSWYASDPGPKIATFDSFRVYESAPTFWEDGT